MAPQSIPKCELCLGEYRDERLGGLLFERCARSKLAQEPLSFTFRIPRVAMRPRSADSFVTGQQ